MSNQITSHQVMCHKSFEQQLLTLMMCVIKCAMAQIFYFDVWLRVHRSAHIESGVGCVRFSQFVSPQAAVRGGARRHGKELQGDGSAAQLTGNAAPSRVLTSLGKPHALIVHLFRENSLNATKHVII